MQRSQGQCGEVAQSGEVENVREVGGIIGVGVVVPSFGRSRDEP